MRPLMQSPPVSTRSFARAKISFFHSPKFSIDGRLLTSQKFLIFPG